MKIGFDISDLSTGRADGTTRFTWELAKRLPEAGEHADWLYFAPHLSKKTKDGLKHERVSLIESPWPKWWTQSRLPWDLYRYRPDVLFMPIQQLPYVRPGKMKTVAVVHDLAVHLYPEQFTYKDWALLQLFSAQAVREADQLICVSQATADDVASFYGRTEDVHAIHHGVDHERFYPIERGGAQWHDSWSKLQQQYPKLQKPYILYVGQLQPRKNLERLIEAFEMLADKDGELRLVIAGGHGWLKDSIIEKVRRSKFAGRILMPGVVPEEFLPALYWQADVFVLPSLYEGFGMPLLEAMACGCPVVTSNVSSMPEVVGDAGVLVQPKDVASIADGIVRARRNKDQLELLGVTRAGRFTWDKTTRATLDTLVSA